MCLSLPMHGLTSCFMSSSPSPRNGSRIFDGGGGGGGLLAHDHGKGEGAGGCVCVQKLLLPLTFVANNK